MSPRQESDLHWGFRKPQFCPLNYGELLKRYLFMMQSSTSRVQRFGNCISASPLYTESITMRQNLGQHFLKNPRKIRAIVDALDLQPGDTVIEIGPGKGALTKAIFRRLSKAGFDITYVGIEKDPELAADMVSWLSENRHPGTRIIQGDVRDVLRNVVRDLIDFGNLTSLLDSRSQSAYKIVGNIPYYLTGRLLRLLGELHPLPARVVLTVQKEVAERAAAQPPRMNLLAASVQVWADASIVANVPRESFSPPPDVDGAVLLLAPRDLIGFGNQSGLIDSRNQSREGYYKTARALFAHPRKTIRNNLREVAKRDASPLGLSMTEEGLDSALWKIGVDPGGRPQNLSVEEIEKISRLVSS